MTFGTIWMPTNAKRRIVEASVQAAEGGLRSKCIE